MKIALEGIKLKAFHGVYPEERKRGTQFVVDIHVDVQNDSAGQSDDLSHTVDYQSIYELTLEIMNQPVNLLETLVQKIGKEIMNRYPPIDAVKVKVSKEKPLGMELCDRTSVEASFTKE
jgi:dihydroneopterin aldolase